MRKSSLSFFMKRATIGKTVFVLGLFLLLVPVFFKARASDVDYLVKRDLYVSAHKDYFSARQAYLNQRTLQTKEVLKTELRRFSFARGDLLVSYFDLLITKAGQYLTEEDLVEIKNWFSWLRTHTQMIDQTTRLEDFLILSDQLNENYPQMEKSIYLALTKTTIAEQSQVIREMEALRFEVAEKVSTIVEDKNMVAHWLVEVSSKISLARFNHEEALIEMKEVKIRRKGDALKAWQRAGERLLMAEKSLKEALGFLDEILKRVEEK